MRRARWWAPLLSMAIGKRFLAGDRDFSQAQLAADARATQNDNNNDNNSDSNDDATTTTTASYAAAGARGGHARPSAGTQRPLVAATPARLRRVAATAAAVACVVALQPTATAAATAH